MGTSPPHVHHITVTRTTFLAALFLHREGQEQCVQELQTLAWIMYTNDKWSYSISWLHMLPLATHVLLFLAVSAQFLGLTELLPPEGEIPLPAMPETLDQA